MTIALLHDPDPGQFLHQYQMNGHPQLVGNDTSYVVLSCFVAKLDKFVFPALRGGGHFEFEPKNGICHR